MNGEVGMTSLLHDLRVCVQDAMLQQREEAVVYECTLHVQAIKMGFVRKCVGDGGMDDTCMAGLLRTVALELLRIVRSQLSSLCLHASRH